MTTTDVLTASAAFQVGGTYSCRSLGDYDCVWTFEVVARTAKFVTLRQTNSGETMRVGVRVWDGDETVQPFGSYSLAPTLRASKVIW